MNKVSVVVPIYNMDKYIERCVNSIEKQTYQNIEVILVDDGSTDNSAEVCKKMKIKFNNIKVILKENGGVSTARNVGMENSTGEWVMFVDPDDYLTETIVEKLILQCKENVDIVICSCVAVEDNKRNICHFFKQNKCFSSFSEKKELYKQLMKMEYGQADGKIYTAIGVPWGKLYRLNKLKKYGIVFNPKLRRVQDNIFNIEAFSISNVIIYIDEPLYIYSYDHMSSYFNKYKRNHEEIFTEVRKSKYECMKKYNLLDDKELYNFYVNEAIVGQANIMKYGIFHRENQDSFKLKINKAKNLSNNECFSMYMNKRGLEAIDNRKYKIYWWMIKLRLYVLIYLISQL